MRDKLFKNQVLNFDEKLYSSNGYYYLVMQRDGNLVLYNNKDYAVWASNTSRTDANHAIMQSDGNLVLYNKNGKVIWATGTDGHPNSFFIIQNDRNLVIYENSNPIWASNTNLQDKLMADQTLNFDEKLYSANGYYYLVMQRDGNLVLYDNQNFAIWASNTKGTDAKYAIMQHDGNLVLYDNNNRPIWATGTDGHFDSYLIIQNDRNLVVYDKANNAIWNTGTFSNDLRLIVNAKIFVRDDDQSTNPINDRNITGIIDFSYSKEGTIELEKKTRNGQIGKIEIKAKLLPNGKVNIYRIAYATDSDKQHSTFDINIHEQKIENIHCVHNPIIGNRNWADFEVSYQFEYVLKRIDHFQKPFYSDLIEQGSTNEPKTVPLIPIIWEYNNITTPPLDKQIIFNMLFGKTNSVSSWVQENSLGKYRVVPVSSNLNDAIIGPIKSTYSKGYYTADIKDDGGKDITTGRTAKDDGFVSNSFDATYADAIRGADRLGVNFSKFDKNNDGNISVDELLILFIKPGSYNDGYTRNLIQEDGKSLVLKGKKFDRRIGELYTDIPNNYTQNLQVAIEEIMHQAIHIKDKYKDGDRMINDPTYPGQFSFTSAIRRPVHLDPYDKLKLGWLRPILVTRPGVYMIRQTNITGDALILYNPKMRTNEFFIVENRTNSNSYDKYRSPSLGNGIAIWHCIQDNALTNWPRFSVNLRRPQPQLYRDTNNDPFPLFSKDNNQSFYYLSDDSFPQNLKFRNDFRSELIIKNISRSGFEMSIEIDFTPEWYNF